MTNTPAGRRFQHGNIHGAKLTPEQVIDIRERYWYGNETQGAIARDYRVSRETIARCVRGETFVEYGGPVPGSRTEPPPAQMLDEVALDRMAMANAPRATDAEIQASLAKLQKLTGGSTPPPAGGDAEQPNSADGAEQPGDKQ